MNKLPLAIAAVTTLLSAHSMATCDDPWAVAATQIGDPLNTSHLNDGQQGFSSRRGFLPDANALIEGGYLINLSAGCQYGYRDGVVKIGGVATHTDFDDINKDRQQIGGTIQWSNLTTFGPLLTTSGSFTALEGQEDLTQGQITLNFAGKVFAGYDFRDVSFGDRPTKDEHKSAYIGAKVYGPFSFIYTRENLADGGPDLDGYDINVSYGWFEGDYTQVHVDGVHAANAYKLTVNSQFGEDAWISTLRTSVYVIAPRSGDERQQFLMQATLNPYRTWGKIMEVSVGFEQVNRDGLPKRLTTSFTFHF